MSSNSSTLKQDAFGLATQGSGPTQERNLVRCLRTGGSMRPTLKIGAKGPDVVRLQTRLNALPSARARLTVNGVFDKNTLQRVKEFQTSTFVDGVVDANDWDALLGKETEQRETFFTDARVLRDPNGNAVVLRGINLPLLDDWSFPGQDRLADIGQTGANAVRIAWYINYGSPERPAYSVADLDRFLTRCEEMKMVAVLGLWDVTCDFDPTLVNSRLMPWWTADEVVTVLRKHQGRLVVNLANELGAFRW